MFAPIAEACDEPAVDLEMPFENAKPVYGVRLRIAYDGTRFSGFARQAEVRTVQGTLEHALYKMTGTHIETRGASRTDAGVHAYDQVVAFDSDKTIPLRGWALGLNQQLEADVSVLAADTVDVGYNPRFDSVEKTYRYTLQLGLMRDPLLRARSWFLGPSRSTLVPTETNSFATQSTLDVEAMRIAGKLLEGTHSFHAFRSAEDSRPNAVRTIHEIRIHEHNSGPTKLLCIDVRGSAFMKNMVRILVGTLLEVGQRKREPGTMPLLLAPEAKRENTGITAPPQGLCLMQTVLGRSGE